MPHFGTQGGDRCKIMRLATRYFLLSCLYNKNNYCDLAQLENRRSRFDETADLSLLLIVTASILVEPINWIVTRVEILQGKARLMTTQDSNFLYEQAEKFLDEGHYSKAVEMYHQAMQMSEPQSLTNFISANAGSLLEFIKKLRKIYPQSLEIRLLEANILAKERRTDIAIDIYTRIISEYSDIKINLRVKMARMSAFYENRQYLQALEDFETIWIESEKAYNPPMIQASLIKGLMRLDDQDAHLYLRMVYSKTFLPEKVKKIIFLKMKQAEMFAEFWAESCSNSVTKREDE